MDNLNPPTVQEQVNDLREQNALAQKQLVVRQRELNAAQQKAFRSPDNIIGNLLDAPRRLENRLSIISLGTYSIHQVLRKDLLILTSATH
jgi:hypothetical protein